MFYYSKSKKFRLSAILIIYLLFIAILPLVSPQKLQAAETYLFLNSWGSVGTADSEFTSPRGIAVDPTSGDVYVSDTNNSRIQKFTSDGTWIATWDTFGEADSFNHPNGIAVNSSGAVFVADRDNNRILKLDSSGNYITDWGSYGSGNGQFNDPHGLALDASSNVYIMDTENDRVQKFDSDGSFITSWGSGAGGFGTARGIAVDGSGNVYVAGTGINRVQKFDSDGIFIAGWGSSGSGDGELNTPRGIAADSSGNVFVADSGNDRIQKFSSTGDFVTNWGSYGTADGEFNDPRALAVNSSGDVYIADTYNHRIQRFTLNISSPGVFGNWDWVGTQPATGDFLGNDGKEDLLGFYSYDKDTTRIWVLRSNGEELLLPQMLWDSGPGNWHGKATKIVAGDYDGNGDTDLIGFHAYGGAQSRVWFFKNNGTGFDNPVSWWDSGPGNWDGNATKLVSGDFDGDQKVDLIGFYAYGGAQSRVWFFKNNGTGFDNPAIWWDSGPGNWDGNATKIAAGDFNADGATDIMGLYAYGGAQSKTWIFPNAAGQFNAPVQNWDSGLGNWNGNHSTFSSGDFDGDGTISSVASFYDYGSKVTGVWSMGPTESGSPSANTWTRHH